MKNPYVTIITVCYNAETEISKTIESVLNQTFNDFEYIIIDGLSKDKTNQIIQSYTDGRIIYISESDNGTYDAMNKGILKSNGEWVCFMNAGDVFFDNNVLKSFFSNDIDDVYSVCYGDTIEEYSFGNVLLNKDESSKMIMPFCHQSSFVRSSILKEYRFDLQYKIVSDHDLFYRLRRDKKLFLHIPIIVSKYNAQYGLSATNPLKLNKEKLIIYGLNKKWYYPLLLTKCYIRNGLIQPLKNALPSFIVNKIMKSRRNFIGK